MNSEQSLDQSFLNECLEYNYKTGEVRWRLRPLNHFSNNTIAKMWNSKHAGKRAGCYKPQSRNFGPRFSINYKVYDMARILYFLETGVMVDMVVPENGDRYDLRFANLIPCTRLQGIWLSYRTHEHHWVDNVHGCWRVRNTVDGKTLYKSFSSRKLDEAFEFSAEVTRKGKEYLKNQDPENMDEKGFVKLLKSLFNGEQL